MCVAPFLWLFCWYYSCSVLLLLEVRSVHHHVLKCMLASSVIIAAKSLRQRQDRPTPHVTTAHALLVFGIFTILTIMHIVLLLSGTHQVFLCTVLIVTSPAWSCYETREEGLKWL
jgi:hypothetical protein